jgi:hypothetical protein
MLAPEYLLTPLVFQHMLDDVRKAYFDFHLLVIIVKLIKNLLSFLINKPKIAKMRVRWWTRFGGSKSGVICIKIYAWNEIISNDYVNSKYIFKEPGIYLAILFYYPFHI